MATRRVGFVIINIDNPYMASIWPGAAEYAESNGIDLVLMPGSQMNGKEPSDRQESHIYDFLATGGFDGFLIASNVFGSSNTVDSLSRFCKRFAPLPYVSLGTRLPGAPTILIDNTAGLKDLVAHFADHHQFRRFAYIRGPMNHPEADERFATFKSVLASRGISFDESLLYKGDFNSLSGIEAARLFLKRRSDVEAIIAANDIMAIACVEELERNGVRIPDDIAVGGFDDIDECNFLRSPLSTVRQPLRQLTNTALGILARLMQGEKDVADIVLPTKVVIRRSCGCLSESVLGVADQPVKFQSETDNESVLRDGAAAGSAATADLSRRVLSYKGGNDETGGVVRSLEKAMYGLSGQTDVSRLWNDYLNRLYALCLSRTTGNPGLALTTLFQRLRIAVADFAELRQAALRVASSQDSKNLQSVLRRISANFDLVSLKENIRQSFVALGIGTAALCLYPDQYRRSDGDWVFPTKAVLAVCMADGRPSGTEGAVFDPRTMLPANTVFSRQAGTYVLMPLYAGNNHFGYMLLKMGPRDGSVYVALRSQLSSSYQAAYILLDQRRQEESLAAVDSRLRVMAKPMLEAIDGVSGIASKRIARLGDLLASSAAAAAKLKSANDSAGRVMDNARGLTEMIAMIEDISVNINLLSINASIESARAGVHGRGFAVIAAEIRKMALGTAENAQKAGAALSTTMGSISASNAQSGEALAAFTALSQEIAQLSESFQEIALSMDNLERISRDMAGVLA